MTHLCPNFSSFPFSHSFCYFLTFLHAQPTLTCLFHLTDWGQPYWAQTHRKALPLVTGIVVDSNLDLTEGPCQTMSPKLAGTQALLMFNIRHLLSHLLLSSSHLSGPSDHTLHVSGKWSDGLTYMNLFNQRPETCSVRETSSIKANELGLIKSSLHRCGYISSKMDEKRWACAS